MSLMSSALADGFFTTSAIWEAPIADLKLSIQKTKITASGPITSWQREGRKSGSVTDFIFLGSKITVDSDCSHEIKRLLLLGRKAITNLDYILKSRDISLPTKVCIIKAMVFPVVIYGCKSWSVKKAECQRIDDFNLMLEKTLQSSLDCKEIQPFLLKGIRPEYSLEGLMVKLKLQYIGHLM